MTYFVKNTREKSLVLSKTQNFPKKIGASFVGSPLV